MQADMPPLISLCCDDTPLPTSVVKKTRAISRKETLMGCEAAAVYTALTWLKWALTWVLEKFRQLRRVTVTMRDANRRNFARRQRILASNADREAARIPAKLALNHFGRGLQLLAVADETDIEQVVVEPQSVARAATVTEATLKELSLEARVHLSIAGSIANGSRHARMRLAFRWKDASDRPAEHNACGRVLRGRARSAFKTLPTAATARIHRHWPLTVGASARLPWFASSRRVEDTCARFSLLASHQSYLHAVFILKRDWRA